MTFSEIVADVTLAANSSIFGDPRGGRAWLALWLISIVGILAALLIPAIDNALTWLKKKKG